MLYRNWVEPETYQRKDVLKYSLLAKLGINPDGIRFQDIQWIHHFKFLTSDTPYCSAYIWVP